MLRVKESSTTSLVNRTAARGGQVVWLFRFDVGELGVLQWSCVRSREAFFSAHSFLATRVLWLACGVHFWIGNRKRGGCSPIVFGALSATRRVPSPIEYGAAAAAAPYSMGGCARGKARASSPRLPGRACSGRTSCQDYCADKAHFKLVLVAKTD